MEYQWNELDWGKPKYWKENLSQCRFVHNSFTWSGWGSNPGLRRDRPAINSLSHGTTLRLN